MKICMGCSGYYYQDWKSIFYPPELPKSKWLHYYAEHFKTLEINSSFYHFPTINNLKKWYLGTPSDFVYAIKGPQNITHYKKFTGVREEVLKFYDVVEKGLKEKLGAILFQLPPSYSYTEERLENICNTLMPEYNNVLEFRHASWWNEKVTDVLREKKITMCSVSIKNLPSSVMDTTPNGYIRFHGVEELYKSSYSGAQLKEWMDNIQSKNFRTVFIYFNNTYNAVAIDNLRKLLSFV